MKQLGAAAYDEIRKWIYRNARPLDLALWQFEFEGGNRETVMEILGLYQNEDGGFANTLDPDNWSRESSPYTTMIAVSILRTCGLTDKEHPIVQGIIRFLDSGVHCSEDGWHFTVPSGDDPAQAPWAVYSEETNREQDMGLTAGLCAFVLRYGGSRSGLYARAAGYVDKILKKVKTAEDLGEMGAGGLGILLWDIAESGLSARFDCSAIAGVMPDLINSRMERNPEKWAFYTPRPSEFIWSPESVFYKGNEEIVDTELDYLIDTRNPGGVWNITWTWFRQGEKYPKEFAVSENWWMASKAIEKMRFLRAFGRIEGI